MRHSPHHHAVFVPVAGLGRADVHVAMSKQMPQLTKNINKKMTWWRHQMETFPRYWLFVREIHRSPVNPLHKGPVTRSFDVFFDLRLE